MALLPRALCGHFLVTLLVGAAGEDAHYSLIFDAGSSGTRLLVYKFYAVQDHTPVFEAAPWSEKQTPGVSDYAKKGEFNKVKERLQSMLTEASKIVPKDLRPVSQVLYFGTAGLRSLTPKERSLTLTTVRDVLVSSEFMFKPEWAKMISGVEEGGFSWLAVNYLMGNFQSNMDRETVGVLEMGGGSAQVVFEIGDSGKAFEDDIFVFVSRIGRKYRLYSHSYMNFGQHYAIESTFGNSTKAATKAECMQSKDRSIQELGECRKVFADGLLAADDAPGKYKHEVPLNNGLFAVVGAFLIFQDSAGMNLAGREMRPKEFGEEASKACQTNENKCLKNKPSNCCTALMYQVAFLEACKFKPETKIKFMEGTSWTLGAAIMAAEEYSKEAQRGLKHWQALVIVGVSSCVVSVAVSALVTLWCSRRKASAARVAEEIPVASVYELCSTIAEPAADLESTVKP